MCLEPFGATGLFILGRGVLLLLVGVVIEKEEEEEKGRGEKGQEEHAHGRFLGTSLPGFIIRSLRRSQPGKNGEEKLYRDRQCMLPGVKVA